MDRKAEMPKTPTSQICLKLTRNQTQTKIIPTMKKYEVITHGCIYQ